MNWWMDSFAGDLWRDILLGRRNEVSVRTRLKHMLGRALGWRNG